MTDEITQSVYYRLPVVACASVPRETIVTALALESWVKAQVRSCGHIRDFTLTCRNCRDILAVSRALDSGAPGVRVVPRNPVG